MVEQGITFSKDSKSFPFEKKEKFSMDVWYSESRFEICSIIGLFCDRQKDLPESLSSIYKSSNDYKKDEDKVHI